MAIKKIVVFGYGFVGSTVADFLKAETEGKASGLGIEKKINLLETPFINITWKVYLG